MEKKLIFISHIHEESELALLFSQTIQSTYLNMLDTFVSSDKDSLPSGNRWVETVTNALDSSVIQLIFCSPYSIYRPWINFESGAAWIRRIPVIPICHSGLCKEDLPIPLRLFQACDINNEYDLSNMFNSLTKVLGCSKPNVNIKEIIEYSNNFSNDYTYFSKIRDSLDKIEEFYPNIKQNIIDKQITSFTISASEYKRNILAPYIDFLIYMKLIEPTQFGLRISQNGQHSTQGFNINPKFYEDAKKAYS